MGFASGNQNATKLYSVVMGPEHETNDATYSR